MNPFSQQSCAFPIPHLATLRNKEYGIFLNGENRSVLRNPFTATRLRRISDAGNPSFLGTSAFCERRRHKQIRGTTSVHFYGSFDNRGTTVPEGQQISTRKSFDPYRDGPS
ncbi:hypothetical protein TNCT_164621 [Trichonephila clavata]|uniref:Uncharacterized protein n=1 Tax=Trichonephila clavata TaxID=2740835 RepID=A0A8X6JA20_TRICU|nr:hypothetical protein TNCT_164621 [Trichonephila clavata]